MGIEIESASSFVICIHQSSQPSYLLIGVVRDGHLHTHIQVAFLLTAFYWHSLSFHSEHLSWLRHSPVPNRD